MNKVNVLYAESSLKHYKELNKHFQIFAKRRNINFVQNDFNSIDYLAVIVFLNIDLAIIENFDEYMQCLKNNEKTILPINISPIHNEINIISSFNSVNPKLTEYLDNTCNDMIYGNIANKIIDCLTSKI